jgi:hypothetical protein
MIGFSSLSHAAGVASFTLATECQLNIQSTERQSSPTRPDSTMSDAPSEISTRAAPSGGLQASQACVTRVTVDSHLSQGEWEQAKRASECEGAGMLKVVARQFRDFVLRTRVGTSRRL